MKYTLKLVILSLPMLSNQPCGSHVVMTGRQCLAVWADCRIGMGDSLWEIRIYTHINVLMYVYKYYIVPGSVFMQQWSEV